MSHATASKPVWTPITDPARIAQIKAAGKYREHLPTWVVRDGVLWVLKSESVGKRL